MPPWAKIGFYPPDEVMMRLVEHAESDRTRPQLPPITVFSPDLITGIPHPGRRVS